MIDTAIGGMKTRFLHKGKNPTLLILASSKRSEKSFLEEHMKKKLSDEESSALIVDEAVWAIKPPETYSGKKFYVGVGNKFLTSEIIPDDADIHDWRDRGYKVIDVPIEFKEDFKDNIDRALCDFAGISSSELTKYISGPRLAQCKSKSFLNPFVKDIIEVGNAPDDIVQYYDFFDINRIPSELKSKPLFMHLDMSISGDKTGIAGVWILGKKAGISDNREMYYQLAFNVSVKAPKGYQVSFAKNREFIYWLKSQGFAIKGISTDTYQNASLAQDLISKGYNYEVISVDRVDSQSKICLPYAYLKNAIYEQRIIMYESDLLTEELLGLERNGNTGKIDHPDGGRYGCFTGDTKVSLVDGRELTFLELVDEFNANKVNYVYSFNEEKKIIEPKKIINAWCTKKDAELVKVTLDNGEVIRCTPNHLFMLRDGKYKEAQLLKKDDSLMPLHRIYSKVVSVEFIHDKEDVYDLTIEDNHNFALSSGVFVHNSKDAADAVAASIWNASNHADEFAFEYGEDLDVTVEVSKQPTIANDRKQIEINMEEMLNRIHDPITQKKQNKPDNFIDFGFGKATTNYNPVYLYEGIIV